MGHADDKRCPTTNLSEIKLGVPVTSFAAKKVQRPKGQDKAWLWVSFVESSLLQIQ